MPEPGCRRDGSPGVGPATSDAGRTGGEEGVLDFRATDPGVIRGMPGPYKGSERAFDALRGPGQHLERLLDAALACEASGLDPVQVLDRAMGAAALAEAELLVQAEDSLQETAEER